MQHEVALALLGCPGDLIRASDQGPYEVDPKITFLSSAERQAINQVCRLGANYADVMSFVDGDESVHGFSGVLSSRPRVDGLYCRALKNGLEEQLGEYRSACVALEAELLSAVLPISYVRFKLHAAHYHLLMPALARLVATAAHDKEGFVCGAHLLGLLHEGAAAGPAPISRCARGSVRVCLVVAGDWNPFLHPPFRRLYVLNLSRSFNRLARHCHVVMYNLCAAWTLHGRLLDPHGEFFVAHGSGGQRHSTSTANADTWASRAWDAAPWVSAGCDGPEALDTRGTQEQEWNHGFVLRVEAIPLSYVPASIAQQILSIGKATRTLRHGTCDGAGLDRSADGSSDVGLSRTEVASFTREFEMLKRAETFHLLRFEALVRRLHTVITSRLWYLVVIEAKLLEHLQAVRDLVLLGRGELWHDFIVRSRDLMRHLPTTRSEDALRDGPLAAAQRNCGQESEGSESGRSFMSRLRVILALESFVCRQFDTVVPLALLTLPSCWLVALHVLCSHSPVSVIRLASSLWVVLNMTAGPKLCFSRGGLR